MIWKMRATNAAIVGIFLVIASQPLSTAVEAGLLTLGLVCAAYYVKLHRQARAEKDQPSDSS